MQIKFKHKIVMINSVLDILYVYEYYTIHIIRIHLDKHASLYIGCLK